MRACFDFLGKKECVGGGGGGGGGGHGLHASHSTALFHDPHSVRFANRIQ